MDEKNQNLNSVPQSGATPSVPGIGTEEFMNQLAGTLMEQSGIVSSADSNIEKSISKAMSGIRESASATEKRINLNYEREKSYAESEGRTNVDTFLEGRSGFATSMATLRRVVETTDKELKDLAMRKEELILQNNAQAASQIADLELQSLKFRQDAEQRVFSNLLGIANFGLSASSESRQNRAQQFQERSQIANIGLEFGIEVGPNDTLEMVVAKAAPFASEQRRAELARTLAETKRINAEISRINSEGATKSELETFDNELLANLYFENPEVIANGLSVSKFASLMPIIDAKRQSDIEADIKYNYDSGQSKEALLNRVKTDTVSSAEQKMKMMNYINSLPDKPKKQSKLRQRLGEIKPSKSIAQSWESL